jgi:O-acetyl-ADP-ribose deacetylase (regulator of RNase III)
MGAGLALECKLRYPEMYIDYVQRCQAGRVKVGYPYIYKGYRSPWIINFPTKQHWKNPSRVEWIESGLSFFLQQYKHEKIKSIAFPKLGCDRGGLSWNNIKIIMESKLNNLEIDTFICLDQEISLTGIESEMLAILNDPSYLEINLSLGYSIINLIQNFLPLERFRDLQKIPGISTKKYCQIFTSIYQIVEW